MPDKRQHRGAHPEDARLFDETALPVLRAATADLSWLLGRGYRLTSALKLVGDRHNLRERQRLAVSRAACSDHAVERRAARRLELDSIRGADLVIDGFNIVITTEAALSGGVLIAGRDGCLRDLSSVHGSYRSVDETDRAITLIGDALEVLGPKSAYWILDRPVSNSGRLASRIRDLAAARGWPWTVALEFNPDRCIAASGKVAITADSTVLDDVAAWVNFNEHLISRYLPSAWVINLAE